MINRRKIFGLIGSLLVACGISPAKAKQKAAQMRFPVMPPFKINSFDDLERWLDSLPNQIKGSPPQDYSGVYYEVFEKGLSRDADVADVEGFVAANMAISIGDYLSRGKGRIYWRIPFERDVMIDKTCKPGWQIVRGYVRFAREAV